MNAPLFLGDIARGLVIAGGAALAGRAVSATASARPRVVIPALALWLAVPALAVAYAWAALPLPHLRQPWTTPILHALLVALRLAPVAALIAALVPPPPLGAAAYHCLRLLSSGRGRTAGGLAALTWAWWTQGPGRRWLVVALVAFPLAFGEFEIGSRLDVGAWSVRLFDAQAGGQVLSATVVECVPGMIIELAALAAAWWLLARGRGSRDEGPSAAPGSSLLITGWLVLALGSAVLVALPLTTIIINGAAGFSAVAAQAGIAREVGASLAFAFATAACAWIAAGRWRWLHPVAAVGLCGSLAVGLMVLALFQAPGLNLAAATPLPLLLALVTLLLPYAVVLRLAVAGHASAGMHQASLLAAGDHAQIGAARDLRWHLAGSRRWWLWSPLFLWSYCDLAASAILHPVDMTPVLVLLYNFMHYGQSAALSGRLALALAAPVAAIAIGYVLMRAWEKIAPPRWSRP